MFNLQKELEKVKILVPLVELLKQPSYKAQVSQFMLPHGVTSPPDSLNLQEERPMVVFGPHVEEMDSATPLFMFLWSSMICCYITVCWTREPHTIYYHFQSWNN